MQGNFYKGKDKNVGIQVAHNIPVTETIYNYTIVVVHIATNTKYQNHDFTANNMMLYVTYDLNVPGTEVKLMYNGKPSRHGVS